MTKVVIVSGARTPIGSFDGGLADIPAHELGAIAIRAVLDRAGLDPTEVEETILGQVLTAAQGQNPARQAHIRAGLVEAAPAWGVNQVCGSGLRAVTLGAQQILTGQAGIVIAGGQESMSLAPHAMHLRRRHRYGDRPMIDTMVQDGLQDAFLDVHMGRTAEMVAARCGIGREAQDAFALNSQLKAAAARQALAEEIVPVGAVVADEHPRATTLAALARLRPAFQTDGTVTAGNASGLNDGAAAMLLMTEAEAARRGMTPLGRIVSHASVGVEPGLMGLAPVPAVRRALQRAGWRIEDLDLVEANEAFAAQALAVNAELGWDPDIVNVNGGAIALGHPIGASGARLLVALLHEMRRRRARRGLVTLCIGGGMGIALCVEA